MPEDCPKAGGMHLPSLLWENEGIIPSLPLFARYKSALLVISDSPCGTSS